MFDGWMVALYGLFWPLGGILNRTLLSGRTAHQLGVWEKAKGFFSLCGNSVIECPIVSIRVLKKTLRSRFGIFTSVQKILKRAVGVVAIG